MFTSISPLRLSRLVLSVLLGSLVLPLSSMAQECSSNSTDSYICGITSAEDLVHLPNTPWILASTFTEGALLNVINTRTKAWDTVAPGGTYTESRDTVRFPHCTGETLAVQSIVTHGLHLTANGDDKYTLYAVGHGAREAIEIFDISAQGKAKPDITWVGCVPTPNSQRANSVVSLSNGDLLATIPIEPGHEFAESMLGVETGAVHRWNTAAGSWQRLDVTAQPYPNGITISDDETRFYVASSGLRRVVAYSNVEQPKLLGMSPELEVIPDNLHRNSKGSLVTAGMLATYTPCNPYNAEGEFSLKAFGSCPRPYQIVTVDPDTLQITESVSGDKNVAFSNITMAVQADGYYWIGTFAGNRVAYRKVEEMP